MWFALQNAPQEEQTLSGLQVTPEPGEDLRLRFDIELHVVEHAGAVDLHWLFKRDLFERESIERLAHQFVRIVTRAMEHPDEPLRCPPVLDAPSRQTVVEQFNATGREVAASTIAALFEAQVVRTPEVAALTCGDASLSYDELNTRANHLAHDLIAGGIGPERIVGVTLERSIDLVVSLLAIIKAGGAYAPIDPDLPAARLERMLADAAPEIVLTCTGLVERLPAGAPWVCSRRGRRSGTPGAPARSNHRCRPRRRARARSSRLCDLHIGLDGHSERRVEYASGAGEPSALDAGRVRARCLGQRAPEDAA